MGTVVTYSRSKSFFDRTLGQDAPAARENGYCGYINLNTIVNDERHLAARVHLPLRLSRLCHLRSVAAHAVGRALQGDAEPLNAQFETEPGFAVGIVVTTPPFPYYRDMVRSLWDCRFCLTATYRTANEGICIMARLV